MTKDLVCVHINLWKKCSFKPKQTQIWRSHNLSETWLWWNCLNQPNDCRWWGWQPQHQILPIIQGTILQHPTVKIIKAACESYISIGHHEFWSIHDCVTIMETQSRSKHHAISHDEQSVSSSKQSASCLQQCNDNWTHGSFLHRNLFECVEFSFGISDDISKCLSISYLSKMNSHLPGWRYMQTPRYP